MSFDTYSKRSKVSMIKSTKFEVFPALDESLACYGKPDKIIHDGWPPYNGHSLAQYAKT